MNKDVPVLETALRMKARFNLNGTCSVEDLWDASLPMLDKLHRSLTVEAEKSEGKSLLYEKSKADEVLECKIATVRYIFEVKREEEALRRSAAEERERKKKIISIIADKEDEGLRSMPLEELRKLAE